MRSYKTFLPGGHNHIRSTFAIFEGEQLSVYIDTPLGGGQVDFGNASSITVHVEPKHSNKKLKGLQNLRVSLVEQTELSVIQFPLPNDSCLVDSLLALRKN